MREIPLNPRLKGLRCAACGKEHAADRLQTTCVACDLPLLAEYTLHPGAMAHAGLEGRVASLWRYAEVLPIAPVAAVTLVEGFTPLLPVAANIWIKDEARNPT